MALTLKEAESFIWKAAPFNAGNLSGVWIDEEFYAVCSYGTVIAVYSNVSKRATLTVDAYQHSKTTSKHANIVKRAWAL
jgi:hypothetical protein